MAGLPMFSSPGNETVLLIFVGQYLPVCYCPPLILALLGERYVNTK
jgi:hypothetical protein